MSFLGGIVKSVINPVSLLQVAMGPAGWASLAVRTIGVAIGKEVIQQLGQKLGLPQSMISLAQNAFSAVGGGKPDLASVLGRAAPSSVSDAVGLVARQFNFSPAQEGNLARSANNMTGALIRDMFEKAKADGEKPEALDKPEASATERKGSWLQALAEAMGAVVDQKMDEITDLSDKITKQNAANKQFTDGVGEKDQGVKTMGTAQSNSQKLGTLTSKLQAATQEMSIMQNTISTALKTIGEAQSTMARKG